MMDLDSLDSLMFMCEAIEPSAAAAPAPEPLDPERFKAYVKSPDELDEETIRDIAAVIDGKLNTQQTRPVQPGTVPVAVPSTVDRLLNSIAIIYITDKDLPIAAASLIDPTVESYCGFIPLSHYSLESGYNLDGRVQQEFFAVADEYRNHGIGRELKAQIAALGIPTFILVDSNDADSIEGVSSNGYQLICELTDTDDTDVQLWIDHDEEQAEDDSDGENGLV